jgi:hypothetical protein
MARSFNPALLLFAFAALPTAAGADEGELALGLGAGLRWPRAVGGELGARLGIGDSLAVDARLGGGATATDDGFGYAEVGVVALFDVLAWVPEARLAVGAEAVRRDVAPVAHATLGLRRYLSADISSAVELGAAWTPEEWRGTLALSLWLALL